MFLNAILWARDTNKDVYAANYAIGKRFKALVYYSTNAEEAHVQFARQGVEFFQQLNYGDGFSLETTTDFSLYADNLRQFDVIVMLNGYPNEPSERTTFEQYMENGGGWVGFYSAANKTCHSQPRPSGYQKPSRHFHSARKRMVPMDSQPPPKPKRRSAVVNQPR